MHLRYQSVLGIEIVRGVVENSNGNSVPFQRNLNKQSISLSILNRMPMHLKFKFESLPSYKTITKKTIKQS